MIYVLVATSECLPRLCRACVLARVKQVVFPGSSTNTQFLIGRTWEREEGEVAWPFIFQAAW